MHVNALRRWTAFPSNWIRFKTNVSRETPPPQQRQEKEFSKTIPSSLTTPPCVSRETPNSNKKLKPKTPPHPQQKQPMFHVKHSIKSPIPNSQQHPQNHNHSCSTWNTNHQQLTEKKQRSQTTNPTVFHVEHDNSLNKLITPTTPTHVPRETKTRN